MKYLKRFNENFSSNESVELPQEVKDALENAVKQLSTEELVALKDKFSEVSEDEIENAVEDAQAQVQSESEKTNENMFKKAGSWVSKNKGTIGASLLIASLAGLGIIGQQADHLVNILKDNQTLDVLSNPAWLTSALGFISGIVMTGSAVKQGFDTAKENSKIEWEKNMVRKGLAKKDENGVLISLKTGKELVYNR